MAAHSIRQFPIDFPSRALPCAITFQARKGAARHRAIDVNVWNPEQQTLNSGSRSCVT